MITFTYPDEMKNGQLERLLVAIEEALENRNFGPMVQDRIKESVDQHGEKATHELLGSYFASWCEVCSWNDPPDEKYYRLRALKYMSEHFSDTEAAIREMTSFHKDTAHFHGRVVNRCGWCGRLRHGLKWKKDKPTPEGWIEIETTCPDCEKQGGHHQATPDPTEQDLQAWLADGDLPADDD